MKEFQTNVIINGAEVFIGKFNMGDKKYEEYFKPVSALPFIVRDTISLLSSKENPIVKICYIEEFEVGQNNKENILNEIIKIFEDDFVIIADAYVSISEFPYEKYYLEDDLEENEEAQGKIKLPIEEVLKRESELLEKCNFVTINDYVGYEYKVAHVYINNEQGKRLRAEIDELKKGANN